MQYRINSRNGDELSALAFGCMRINKNEKEAQKDLVYAIEHGVNYFDTAYIYYENELLLGKILPKEYRTKIKLATKLPPYLVKKHEDFDKFFYTQLQRLQTDYIDYYLIHMLQSLDNWSRLCKLGIEEWIASKQKNGEIKNIGYSYHGGKTEFKGILDAYNWDFCMVQYNYLDVNNQAGNEGVRYANGKGIPVFVMEPVRGGTLANSLPQEVIKLFKNHNPNRTPAEWALRWVWNHSEITTVLSGMGSMDMLKENIAAANQAVPNMLTDEELLIYDKARDIILRKLKVHCTGCSYCMPCPQGVDIPLCFSSLNDMSLDKSKLQTRGYYIIRTNGHNASLCVNCGQCEKHCPQGIPIREKLGLVKKEMESFPFKPMRAVMRKVMKLPCN